MRNLKIQYIHVSKTTPSSSHIFFIPPSLWLPNSLDLNPVDYAVWGILQEPVYTHHRITDVEELHQRVKEEWDRLDQEVIDNAISE